MATHKIDTVVLHKLFVLCILNKKCGCQKQTAWTNLKMINVWSSFIVFQFKCKGDCETYCYMQSVLDLNVAP